MELEMKIFVILSFLFVVGLIIVSRCKSAVVVGDMGNVSFWHENAIVLAEVQDQIPSTLPNGWKVTVLGTYHLKIKAVLSTEVLVPTDRPLSVKYDSPVGIEPNLISGGDLVVACIEYRNKEWYLNDNTIGFLPRKQVFEKLNGKTDPKLKEIEKQIKLDREKAFGTMPSTG